MTQRFSSFRSNHQLSICLEEDRQLTPTSLERLATVAHDMYCLAHTFAHVVYETGDSMYGGEMCVCI